LKSLDAPDARVLSEDSVEISVRDIANNMQLDLTFIKVVSRHPPEMLQRAACLLLMYDVSRADTFKHVTDVVYPHI